MVIFAVGGVIAGGVIGVATYDDYSDSSFESYDDDYICDAEISRLEREVKRLDLESEKIDCLQDIEDLKSSEFLEFLAGTNYADPDSFNDDYDTAKKVNKAVEDKIKAERKEETDNKTSLLKAEIAEIDKAIKELEKIKANLSEE